MKEAPRRQAAAGGIPWAHDNGQLWTDGALNRQPSAGKRDEVYSVKAEHGQAFLDRAQDTVFRGTISGPTYLESIPRSAPFQSF